jgi:hypothetical protein
MKRIIAAGILSLGLLAACSGTASPQATAVGGTGAEQPTVAGNTGVAPTTEEAPAATTESGVMPTTGAMATTETGAAPTTAAGTGTEPTTAAGTGETNGTGAQPTTAAGTGETNGTGAQPTTAAGTTADVTQPVMIPGLGLSFMVPANWQQVANENAWSPAGAAIPQVGVKSAQSSPDYRPSSFLPEGAVVKSTESVVIPTGQATVYTVENTDGTAESHMIFQTGTTFYDFYARASSQQELQTLRPVLNDILSSVKPGGA